MNDRSEGFRARNKGAVRELRGLGKLDLLVVCEVYLPVLVEVVAFSLQIDKGIAESVWNRLILSKVLLFCENEAISLLAETHQNRSADPGGDVGSED